VIQSRKRPLPTFSSVERRHKTKKANLSIRFVTA
jgi:hypothetical protein